MYSATVIADSISPDGHRLTTVRAVYPHAVHKDLLRHRCMNRNVESFRAMPPEKLIEALRNGHAFMPDVFAKRTKGMGQSAEEVADAKVASALWDAHVEGCIATAEHFLKMDIAKQQVNFLLQDLCPLTEIITATDWSNFYALRTELKEDGTPVARPEVYRTAVAIKTAIEASTPTELDYGELHLPMLTVDELADLCSVRKNRGDVAAAEDYWIGVSAGRCARVSYGDFKWWEEGSQDSYDRSRRLLAAIHLSPFEQQARVFSKKRWQLVDAMVALIQNQVPNIPQVEADEMCRQLEYSGNLHGWVPARKSFVGEWDYSSLRKAMSV